MGNYSTVEKKVLTQLQRGIEPVSRPFQTLELPEEEVLALLRRAQEKGLLRRFGGVFDARRLGYKSILCALDVPDGQLAEKAALIAAHPGVTHCYERSLLDGTGGLYPSLWFTLAVLHDRFDEKVEELRSALDTRHTKLYELPAVRRFKIDVVFDLKTRNRDETFPGNISPDMNNEPFRAFSDAEKALVRALDQQLSLVEQPFAAVAEQIGQSEAWVLSTLQAWKEQGILRRIGAILYHRKAGFSANAMCVWPVDGDVAEAGRRIAARPEVTHCYQRPRIDRFPFDLYAMIHGANRVEIEALFRAISAGCGLAGGALLVSAREFKKTSMEYFRSE